MNRRVIPIVAVLAGLALVGVAGFILATSGTAGDDGQALPGSPSEPADSGSPEVSTVEGAVNQGGSSGGSAAVDEPRPVDELVASAVRLLGLDDDGDVVCAESGVVVTNDGAVLSTSRLSGDDPSCPFATIGVALTYHADSPTELMYEASAVAAKGDFIVLRPTGVLGTAPWPPLPWRPAPLGFGIKPDPGDEVRVLGFNEILDREARVQVSETRLNVVEPRDDGYRLDGTLAAGNGGGMAVDENGRVVGLVDVDGPETGILSIDVAQPVLEAGHADDPMGAVLESGTATVDIDFDTIVLSSPRFTEQDDLEAETIEAIGNGEFETVKVGQAGKQVLCLIFAWDGIPVGATWDALWYHNGVAVADQASTDMTWSIDEETGPFFWQCAQDPDGLKPGTWEFGFRIGGRTMFVQAIEVVGNPPEEVPLEWVNQTGQTLCSFAVNPVAELDYVGLNVFEQGKSMASGEVLRYPLPPGRYVVEAKDCDGNVVVGVYDGLDITADMDRLELEAS